MLSAEQLREHWKTQKAPACFDPNQPNWADITVQEIGKAFDPLKPRRGTLRGETTYGPISKDQLPFIPASYYPSISIAAVFDEWEGSSQARQALPFLDPEDKLYFEAYTGYTDITTRSYIFIRHIGSLVSSFWEQYWGLQIDVATKVEDLEGDELKALSLIPPQSARGQHRSHLYPEIHIINREAWGRNHPWIDNQNRPPVLADPWLLYSKYLMVPRDGQYPFNDETKSKVITAAVEVIDKDTTYENIYRANLSHIYYLAGWASIELPGAFAAREV